MSRWMNTLAAVVRKPLTTPFARRCVLASAALAALGGSALPASAGHDDRGRYDYRGPRDNRDYRDYHSHGHTDKRVDVDFNLHIGGAPRRYEPCYEERQVRVWCPPVYKTVVEKRWVEPVYQTVCEKVWVPDRYEVRQVRGYDRRHGWHMCEERVLVCAGHYDNVERRVCVREGYFENCERQVCVSEGHWDTKIERVQVGTREVYAPFNGLALRIGK
jgi:hypothetical protein